MPNKAKSTLSLRFKVKPGCKDAMLKELKTILDLCNKEPEFITAIICESKEKPDEIMLFELWQGTYEEFVEVQGPKPYRETYHENSKKLVESVEVHWNTPIMEWGTHLLKR